MGGAARSRATLWPALWLDLAILFEGSHPFPCTRQALGAYPAPAALRHVRLEGHQQLPAQVELLPRGAKPAASSAVDPNPIGNLGPLGLIRVNSISQRPIQETPDLQTPECLLVI